MEVDRSDLQKIHDVLTAARDHHVHRDESNARLHLAPSARLSPLTSSLDAACDRLDGILRAEL